MQKNKINIIFLDVDGVLNSRACNECNHRKSGT